MFRSFTKPVFSGREIDMDVRNVNNESDTNDLLLRIPTGERWLLSPHAVSAGTFSHCAPPHSNDREKRSRQANG